MQIQINNDMEHTVGSFIGATLGIVKSIFSFTIFSIIGSPFIETAIMAFIGGGLGYVGTTLFKWIHEIIKEGFRKKLNEKAN